MSLTKNELLNWYFQMKKQIERFRCFSHQKLSLIDRFWHFWFCDPASWNTYIRQCGRWWWGTYGWDPGAGCPGGATEDKR